MKRILTVLFMLGAVASVSAQSGRQSSRDVVLGQENRGGVYNDGRYNNDRYDRRHITARERDLMIQRINREYESRIWSVKRDRYLRNSERNRQIRRLERERAEEIRLVNLRYHQSRNHGNGRNGGRW